MDDGNVRQGPTQRFEEYLALRQEMLALHSFCRQILYWTMLLVIVGFAWYVGLTVQGHPKIPAPYFAVLLMCTLILSSSIFGLYMSHIFWLGSFIAVFWESRDAARMLRWHRFSRQAQKVLPFRPKFMRDRLVRFLVPIVYGLTALILVASVWFLFPAEPSFHYSIMLAAFALACLYFLFVVQYVERLKAQYEEGWLMIWKDTTLQEKIHRKYDGDA